MIDETFDPLANPSIRDLCREDPGVEIALRKRFPAAGGGDQDWAAATEAEVRRWTSASGEGRPRPEDEVAPVLGADDTLT